MSSNFLPDSKYWSKKSLYTYRPKLQSYKVGKGLNQLLVGGKRQSYGYIGPVNIVTGEKSVQIIVDGLSPAAIPAKYSSSHYKYTYMVLTPGATVSLGGNADKIALTNAAYLQQSPNPNSGPGAVVNMGAGDDSLIVSNIGAPGLTGVEISDGRINFGSGNDLLAAKASGYSMYFSTSSTFDREVVAMGDGDDQIRAENVPGADDYYSGAIFINGTAVVSCGSGNDIVTGTTQSTEQAGLFIKGTLDMGEGDDIIAGSRIYSEGGRIFTGPGDDLVEAPYSANTGKVDMGSGIDKLVLAAGAWEFEDMEGYFRISAPNRSFNAYGVEFVSGPSKEWISLQPGIYELA